MHRLSRRAVLFILTAVALSLGVAGGALAAHRVGFRHVHGAAARQQAFRALLRARAHKSGLRQAHGSIVGHGDSDLADEESQYGFERTAPGLTVSGQALIAAGQQAAGLSVNAGPWQQLPPSRTTRSRRATPTRSGPTSAPASPSSAAGSRRWRTRRRCLVRRARPTAACGAPSTRARTGPRSPTPCPHVHRRPRGRPGGRLAVARHRRGQRRRTPTGRRRVGPRTDGQHCQHVGGATTRSGRAPSSASPSTRSATRTRPPTTACSAATRSGGSGRRFSTRPAQPDFPPYDQQVTDVAVVPGTGGQDVITAIGWHGPALTPPTTASTSPPTAASPSARSRRPATSTPPTSAAPPSPTRRTAASCTRSSSRRPRWPPGDETVLQGIFVVRNGRRAPASTGPWTKIGDEATLAASGSALAVGSGYGVGVQAWYNQDLAVDPATRTMSTWASRRSSSPPTAARPGSRPARTGTTASPATPPARTPRTPTSTR